MNDKFDSFNYPNNHFLFSIVNKKLVLNFKEEAAGKIIEKFIALKLKLYSLEFADKFKKKHLPDSPHGFHGFLLSYTKITIKF